MHYCDTVIAKMIMLLLSHTGAEKLHILGLDFCLKAPSYFTLTNIKWHWKSRCSVVHYRETVFLRESA